MGSIYTAFFEKTIHHEKKASLISVFCILYKYIKKTAGTQPAHISSKVEANVQYEKV